MSEKSAPHEKQLLHSEEQFGLWRRREVKIKNKGIVHSELCLSGGGSRI